MIGRSHLRRETANAPRVSNIFVDDLGDSEELPFLKADLILWPVYVFESKPSAPNGL